MLTGLILWLFCNICKYQVNTLYSWNCYISKQNPEHLFLENEAIYKMDMFLDKFTHPLINTPPYICLHICEENTSNFFPI